MAKTVLILQGHPDPGGGHLDHALADAYAEGAREGGHGVRRIETGRLDFPLLRTPNAFLTAGLPPALEEARAALEEAEHLAVFFPLWLGTVPAHFKGFLEQLLRPGIAFDYVEHGTRPRLKGRSARVVVTMGMPALAFRLWFQSAGLAVLNRNILGLVGISPVRSTVLGSVEAVSPHRRARWIEDMKALGRRAI